MASAHIRFNDDIDHYDPSDSETEYTEKEKDLLKKTREKRAVNSDSEEEVFGLDQENSDDSDIADSDIEGQEDDGLPDPRAWGQSKRSFYSTDYVDPDYGGYEGKDAEAANQEEEEARVIQQRLAEELDDDDFALDIFNKKSENESTEKEEEVIVSDLTSLSNRQILQLFKKESPEFFVLVEDCKAKMEEVKGYLAPIIQLDKEGKIPNCEALEFVKTHYHLILNYCTNIYMYLLLKASRVNIKNHPVIKRLYQYRQLILQLEPVYIEIIRPQIDILIEMNKVADEDVDDGKPVETSKEKPKKLQLLEKLDILDKKIKNASSTNTITAAEPFSKKAKYNTPVSILKTGKHAETKNVSFEIRKNEIGPEKKITKGQNSDSESDQNMAEEQESQNQEQNTDESKRAITYQMAKNKGLTPRRKKEQRNPRVKHRNKFRKANIRRKGAVREVRTEMKRYGGEFSGIKASVSKGIKIK